MYVCCFGKIYEFFHSNCGTGAIHCGRGTVKPTVEAGKPQHVAIENYGYLGYCSLVPCACDKQGWDMGHSISSRVGESSMQSTEIKSPTLAHTELQAEAGMFPGVILQMCYWYRPDEMSIRLLYFCECP